MISPGPKNVLILGAGLVSRPIVRFFLEDDGARLTLASLALADAHAMVRDHPRGRCLEIDVTDPGELDPLVRASDLVISLVPYAFHVGVARSAIRHGVDMITASYVFPEMRALDAAAREAGITILNEIGLDPGLDHMSAMSMIDRVRRAGGKVVGFRSCCGSLPAPEAATNPWKYKFSWSPRGALSASRLPARYLDEGRVVEIPGERLFRQRWPYDVEEVGRFEIYPNRDSLPYIEAYDLEGLETMLRATIRYPGWCETMQAIAALGLLDVDVRAWPEGTTHADFLSAFLPAGKGLPKTRLAARLALPEEHPVVARLEWAGLFSDEPLPASEAAPLDILTACLEKRMKYREGERDMVLLRHELRVRYPDRPDQREISLLVAYGEPGGDSATSRTVSLPAAVAAKLLLEGGIEPGVQIPTVKAIYEPVLAGLETMGIGFREWSEPIAETLDGLARIGSSA